jgi:predicted XRE-type DNA-binding protein
MAINRSTGNVFLDVGFGKFEAEEFAVKADLISIIALAIEKRGLKQAQAAKLCGTHQSSLSKILSGKLDSVTIEQLAKWIIALGGNVEISASSPSASKSQKPGSLSFHSTD